MISKCVAPAGVTPINSIHLYPTLYLKFLILKYIKVSSDMCPNWDSSWFPSNQVMDHSFPSVAAIPFFQLLGHNHWYHTGKLSFSNIGHPLVECVFNKKSNYDYFSMPLLLPPWSKVSCHISPRLFYYQCTYFSLIIFHCGLNST